MFREFSAVVVFRVTSILMGLGDILLFSLVDDVGFQSFYYSIVAIIALQALFELGAMTAIQSWSALTKSSDYQSMSHKDLRDFTVILSLIAAFLFSLAAYYYSDFLIKPFSAQLFSPTIFLIFYTLSNSILFFNLFIYSFRIGSGDLIFVYILRTLGLLLAKASFLICAYKFGFYEVVLLIPAIQAVMFTASNLRFFQLVRVPTKSVIIKTFPQLFTFQKNLIVSWIGGIFLYQTIIPVLNIVNEIDLIGQFGMTLAAIGGLMSISVSYGSSQVVKVGRDYRAQNYVKNRKVFFRALFYFLFTFLFLTFLFTVLKSYFIQANFLSGSKYYLLIVAVLCSGIGFVVGDFIRAHGVEYTHKITLCAGIAMLFNGFVCSITHDVLSFFVIYVSIHLVSSVLGLLMVKKLKKLYRD